MMTRIVLFYLFVLAHLAMVSCIGSNPDKQKAEKYHNTDTITTLRDTAAHSGVSDIVTSFIRSYTDRDQDALNQFIHPEVGLVIVHRPGAMNWFERVENIDFNTPVPSYQPYISPKESFSLTYETAPTYDCSTESWNKRGLYIDLTTQTNILAPIAAELAEYEDIELDPNYQKQISDAELNSYRVVLTGTAPLIFHVKEFEGKWYVTILDRAYSDCSA